MQRGNCPTAVSVVTVTVRTRMTAIMTQSHERVMRHIDTDASRTLLSDDDIHSITYDIIIVIIRYAMRTTAY